MYYNLMLFEIGTQKKLFLIIWFIQSILSLVDIKRSCQGRIEIIFIKMDPCTVFISFELRQTIFNQVSIQLYI